MYLHVILCVHVPVYLTMYMYIIATAKYRCTSIQYNIKIKNMYMYMYMYIIATAKYTCTGI